MSKKRKEKQKKHPAQILGNKSDEELIKLAHSIQEMISLDNFLSTDLILREAIISQLEDRGFVVKEVLKIVHSKVIKSKEGNQDKGGDEELGGKEKDPYEHWTDN